MTTGTHAIALARATDASASRPVPAWLVLAILAAYIVPGLVGHDPWKQDEAYVFGGVYDMLRDGDWLVAKVGGVPFMEKPPLYHWIAAICARAFHPWLPLHDGARLASGLFVALSAGAVALAARLAWGEGQGRIGALAALSAVGLVTNAQLMLTDLPLMAGFALATAGLAASHARKPWGGIVLGIGVGIGFLAKGVFAPAVIGVGALVLPLAFPTWRTRRYGRDLAIALAASLPCLLVWPIALWLRSPALVTTWFWDNNIGRYLGFSVARLGAATETGFWLQNWPWFLFPLWLLVLSALVRDRARFLAAPGAQIGLTLAGCIAAVLATSASARAIYALPMIPPLALAVAGGRGAGEGRVDRGLFWLGISIASAAILLAWRGWAGLAFAGHAPDWPWLTRYFPPDFALELDYDDIAFAALITVGYGLACVMLRGQPYRGLVAWVGALATAWALVALLWLPWIDNAKSYRGVYESMARAMPEGVDCVASLELGESERAMLDYVAGIRTLDAAWPCAAVLRERRIDKPVPPVPRSWRLVWSGSRPGDQHDRFELWLRPSARGS
jgi:4-amino-4-deoxy-L-arabinose transferase-like glycosyltransferase